MKLKTREFWMFKRPHSDVYMLLGHFTESNLLRCKHDEIINPHLLNDLQRTKPALLILLQPKAKKKNSNFIILKVL